MVWHLFLTVWYRFIPNPSLELPPPSYGNIFTPCWPKKNTRPESTKCRRNPLIIDHLADFLGLKTTSPNSSWGVFLLQMCIQYTNKSDTRSCVSVIPFTVWPYFLNVTGKGVHMEVVFQSMICFSEYDRRDLSSNKDGKRWKTSIPSPDRGFLHLVLFQWTMIQG